MFVATDENDFEVAMVVYVGEHILTMMKRRGVLASVYNVGWVKQDRMAAETVAL